MSASKLTKKEIAYINTTHSAIPKRKYYGADGTVYEGTKDGLLIPFVKASQVSIVTNNTTTSVPITLTEDLSNVTNIIEEIEAEIQFEQSIYYKVLSYDSNFNVTNKSVFTNSQQTVKLFNVDYEYDVNYNLTQFTVTRISDGFQFIKILTYDVDGNVENIQTIKN